MLKCSDVFYLERLIDENDEPSEAFSILYYQNGPN